MFPNNQIPFGQYSYMQPLASPFSPLFMPNAFPVIYPNFQQQITGTSSNLTKQMRNRQFSLQSTANRAQNSTLNREIPSQHPISKDRQIRKPANRPATYLTEKKYYLNQALPEEDASGKRCLRPRHQKKKHHKKYKLDESLNERKKFLKEQEEVAEILSQFKDDQENQVKNDEFDFQNRTKKAVNQDFQGLSDEKKLGKEAEGKIVIQKGQE